MANLETMSPLSAPLKASGPAFWAWFDNHTEDTWPFKVWFISFRIKVGDLRGLFERIFGAHP